MEDQIVLALIPALFSLVITVIGYYFAKRNILSQENLKKRNIVSQEELKAKLDEIKGERDARRDYEYDAKKRLYREIEPLFFLLNEMSEDALQRINRIAEAAKKGKLKGEDGWLSGKTGYFLPSTMYRLISPLAIFKLIQQRLTIVDLSLDQKVKTRYELMKYLYRSFSDDFEFADIEPKIEYKPYEKGWKDKKLIKSKKYWRQGITSGRLDNAVESLLEEDTGKNLRCMSFGGFKKSLEQKKSNISEAFYYVRDVFINFHPQTRPILWRILVTQAYLYLALECAFTAKRTDEDVKKPIKIISEEQRKEKFDWRSKDERENGVSDDEVLVQPFEVSEIYIKKHLKQYFAFPE